MKKVVGIFITMVLVALMASMAFASGNPKCTGSEGLVMLEDWIKSQKCEKYLREDFEGGVKYTYGVIMASNFKELTGEEYTENGLKKLYLNAKNYGGNFNATEVSVRLIGFVEGYNVYGLDIKTETEPLGNENGIDYYIGSAVFMVCEE